MDAHLPTFLTQFEKSLQSEALDNPALLAQAQSLIDNGQAHLLLEILQRTPPFTAQKPPDLRLVEAGAKIAIGDSKVDLFSARLSISIFLTGGHRRSA